MMPLSRELVNVLHTPMNDADCWKKQPNNHYNATFFNTSDAEPIVTLQKTPYTRECILADYAQHLTNLVTKIINEKISNSHNYVP